MKRRHLTPKEICAQCKAVARESRMADITPWSAMGILCGYVLMKVEGFKGKRIARIANKVNDMEVEWTKGLVDLEEVSKRLMDKAEWTVEFKPYTEADIKYKKGTFEHWFDSVQIGAQNTINEQATRYMLFFFTALMDEYKYGKERLTRIEEYMNELLNSYQKDKTTVREWKKALYDEAGVVYEMPVDPLTRTSGSIMTD